MDAKKVLADALASELAGELHTDEISKIIEKPKYEKQGDLSFPCL